MDVGDFHRDVEEVLFGVQDGDFVADGGGSGSGEEEKDEKPEGKQIPRFADSARNDKF